MVISIYSTFYVFVDINYSMQRSMVYLCDYYVRAIFDNYSVASSYFIDVLIKNIETTTWFLG